MKPKLLILDDELPIVRAFERCLKYTYDVVTATNVRDAAALIGSVDVLLTDWNIGADTPMTLLGRVPTVILTGNPDRAAKAVRSSTVCVVIAKPAYNDLVIASLRAVLEAHCGDCASGAP